PPPPSVRPVPGGPVSGGPAPGGPVSAGPVSAPTSRWTCGGSPPPRPGCQPPVMLLIGGELGVDHVIVARGAGLVLRGGGAGGARGECGGEGAQPAQRRFVRGAPPRARPQRAPPRLLGPGHRTAEARDHPPPRVRGGTQRVARIGQPAPPPVLVAVPLG